jgi:hypothetical protein
MNDNVAPFVHRILRLVAWVGLMYGCAQLLAALLELSPGYGSYWQIRSMGRITRASGFVGVLLGYGAMILFIVGASGMLNWKAWSRKVLVAGALLQIASAVGLLIASYGLYVYLRQQPNQPSNPALWVRMLIAGMRAIANIAFPVIVLRVMFQREVKDLWAMERRGGFDVIPLAKVAAPSSEAN